MKKKHGIGMSLIATLAALIMVLVVGVVSVLYIGLKHLRDKIKL